MGLSAMDIDQQYHGDVSQICKGEPSSAEVVRRFLEFKGFGPKLANMTANILAMEFKVAYSDYLYMDVSADRHVKQVLSRLGLGGWIPVMARSSTLHMRFHRNTLHC